MAARQESVELYAAGLRIHLCGPYFRRFLAHGTTMGRQIVESLSSHSRILALTGMVRQTSQGDANRSCRCPLRASSVMEACAGSAHAGLSGYGSPRVSWVS